MTRQNLVDFNFADPFYQYPERRHLRDHGNRNNRNKKVNYNIAKIISNLKSIYNQRGLKKFVDAIKGTTKKLLLMILQKVLVNKNKFERRFVDILSVRVGRSRPVVLKLFCLAPPFSIKFLPRPPPPLHYVWIQCPHPRKIYQTV